MTTSLNNSEIHRYSRQLIIPQFGIENQLKLKAKSALIIGCGGLGCPAGLYLSTAGVGKLGFVDNDTIEISNIHRQIAHEMKSVGKSKAQNLADKCRELNDLVEYEVHECLLEKNIAQTIIEKYDVVLDCTDNVITRYLINDVCVLLGKPLVSGSALKFEGQLTVYNYGDGPCYRCLYPKAPAPETVSNCSDAGIMGPIVGMIGSLQALEAIKVLANIGGALNGRMLIFDGLDFTTRVIKLRPRQVNSCQMCMNAIKLGQESNAGDNKQTVIKSLLDNFDYTQFCGVSNYNDKTLNINILDESQRISCPEYKSIENETNVSHLLLDVRPQCQFKICSLPNSINIPFDDFDSKLESIVETVKNELKKLPSDKKSIFIVCRRGNDSQIAVETLTKRMINSTQANEDTKLNVQTIKDLIGGLEDWSRKVDPNFPKY